MGLRILPQNPEPLFSAQPCPPGTTPAPDERIATGTDGTMLLVRRLATGGAAATQALPATASGVRIR
jgi:hypothetical protein